METPPRFLICPHCQTENLPDRETCLRCGQPLLLMIGADDPWKPPAAKEESPRAFHIGTLMAIIALIGVGLGIAVEAPGLGILLLLIATPALIRTAIVASRLKGQGRPMRMSEVLITFAASSGVVVAIALGAGIAFVVTCFPLGSLAFSANQVALIWAAFALGGVVAVVVAVFLIKRLWPRKD